MASTLEDRCARYEWKLRHGYGSRAKDYSIEEQVERFRQGQERIIWLVEVLVRQMLDAEGIATIVYPFYYAFARSLDKLWRNEISGEALALEAAILMGVWVARGLSQSVLETIRTQVFNISAPTP